MCPAHQAQNPTKKNLIFFPFESGKKVNRNKKLLAVVVALSQIKFFYITNQMKTNVKIFINKYEI
jgi:hypothetical protein